MTLVGGWRTARLYREYRKYNEEQAEGSFLDVSLSAPTTHFGGVAHLARSWFKSHEGAGSFLFWISRYFVNEWYQSLFALGGRPPIYFD